ncbi:MAG TPA: acyl-CoA dehydrogenase family protein [Acidobacteriota bacterium]|nr:acyl-CoA dehydrogenase family protein [Acidobacteriota bacterium]
MNPLLSGVEQRVRDQARAMASEHVAPRAADIDSSGRCPEKLVTRLHAEIFAEVDGTSATPMHLVLRLEQVARRSAAAAAIAAAHGVGMFLTGKPDAQSTSDEEDPTYAVVCGRSELSAEGLDDGATRLLGTVDLVPGAAYATVFVIACEEGDAAGIFIVGKQTEGLTVGPPQSLMGLVGSGTASVGCTGVELPPAARIGDGALASTALDATRIAHAAQAVGIAAGALDAALDHVSSDAAGSAPSEQPQAIQWMLADIATESEAARLTVWHAALELGAGNVREAAATCRLLASEAAVEASRRAMQIAGEKGALSPSVLERLYRDAKLMEVLGGTNEDQLGIIAEALLPDLSR